jgi:hypothetical protein
MARKASKPGASQDLKSNLKILKDRGLYKPKNSRAAPTGYAKRIAKKFSDVISGKASVVTAKSAKHGGKGFIEAARLAMGDRAGTIRAVRNKVIVPTQGGEQARYSVKTGRVRVTRKTEGGTYVRESFPGDHRSLKTIKAQLKPGDRVAVPLFRGRKGVEWQTMELAEFEAFWRQYSSRGTAPVYDRVGKRKIYHDLASHVQIFRYEAPRAPRKRKLI